MNDSIYKFKAKVWLYPGMAAWHFITLPKNLSTRIKKQFSDFKRGWGSLPVTVTIGKSTWQTSIFPDSKVDSYLLPIKADVRKKELIVVGQQISLTLMIRINDLL